MKVIKVILIAVVVLVLVVIAGAFIFIKTFDINRYKPQVIKMASLALNRQVDFEKAFLDISLRQGVSIKVSNVSIAEDPAFGQGDFLSAKDISLAVDALGYLLHKKVSVSSVRIDALRVKIMRAKDGSINVQTIAQPGGVPAAAPAATAASALQSTQKPAHPLAPMALPAILVSSLEIGNGATLTYIDHSAEPGLEIVVSDLSIKAGNISLTDAFPFTIDGTVLSAQKNIHFEGKMLVDLASGGVKITAGKLASDLSALSLAKIPEVFPAAKGAVLPVSLAGKAEVALDKMDAGAKGLTALAATISLAEGSMKFKEMAVPVKNMQARVQVTESAMRIENVSAGVGEGTIQATGSLDEYLTKQAFNLTLSMDKVKLQELVAADSLPCKPEGVVAAVFSVKGEGFSPQALTAAMSGQGTLDAKQIVLKDINLLRAVLDKVSVIPGLADKIETSLPDKYKQKLEQKDTALSDIHLPAVIENGRIVAKDTAIAADDFSLKGSTEAGFDGSYQFEGSFLISPELSAAMVTAVPELQYVLNEDKQILFPVKVKGQSSGMKFSVDAKYVAQKLMVNQGTQQLIKALDKALGAKGTDTGSAGGSQAGTDTRAAVQESLGNLVNSLFKEKK